MASLAANSIGFIGLGAMGFGMASRLHSKDEYDVVAYDVNPTSADRFKALGGRAVDSPRAVAASSGILILMVKDASQVDSVLFDEQNGALKGMYEPDLWLRA